MNGVSVNCDRETPTAQVGGVNAGYISFAGLAMTIDPSALDEAMFPDYGVPEDRKEYTVTVGFVNAGTAHATSETFKLTLGCYPSSFSTSDEIPTSFFVDQVVSFDLPTYLPNRCLDLLTDPVDIELKTVSGAALPSFISVSNGVVTVSPTIDDFKAEATHIYSLKFKLTEPKSGFSTDVSYDLTVINCVPENIAFSSESFGEIFVDGDSSSVTVSMNAVHSVCGEYEIRIKDDAGLVVTTAAADDSTFTSYDNPPAANIPFTGRKITVSASDPTAVGDFSIVFNVARKSDGGSRNEILSAD